MLITRITNNFYQISDAFDQSFLDTLNQQYSGILDFIDRPCGDALRREYNVKHLSTQIKSALSSIVILAEQQIGILYQNTPQLWIDFPGYENSIHIDASPNLSVNIQIYLNDDDILMGTHCYDEQWFSVPFKKNCGYMLFNPTKIEHGMKYPVQTERRSLYQSYRLTKEASTIW
jgi:hypothetical protein